MEKNELLKLWAEKIANEIGGVPPGTQTKFTERLGDIYDLAFEAGKDAEKLRVQLSQHGKPYGYETD